MPDLSSTFLLLAALIVVGSGIGLLVCLVTRGDRDGFFSAVACTRKGASSRLAGISVRR